MNFSLHYSIKYFESIFLSVKASFLERFPEKCSTFHSNAGHYKEEFDGSVPSRKYWSRVTWIDCNGKLVKTLFQQGSPFIHNKCT